MSADGGDNIDFVLGEMHARAARQHQRRLAAEPELAREASEIRALIEDLRHLDTEPSHTIPLRVRYALDRRLRLRLQPPRLELPLARRQHWSPQALLAGAGQVLLVGMQVAAVALVVCCALLQVEERLASPRLGAGVEGVQSVEGVEAVEVAGVPGAPPVPIQDQAPEPGGVDELAVATEASAAMQVPEFVHDEPEFERHLRSLARNRRAAVSDFEGFMDATNKLFTLRRECQVRVSPRQRREAIREGGSSACLDGRIQDLAAEIAGRIDDRLAGGEATVVEVTLAVRALLAAGSYPQGGLHEETVRRCGRFLEEQVAHLEGAQLASALAGLMDLAVVTGPFLERLVGEHADRLARRVFCAKGKERPSLLHWQSPAASLADAGVVLRLAPAFGVNVLRAGEARLLLAAHIQERIASTRNERPDLVAALLYGFGDLVDRPEFDHKLLLWPPQRLGGLGHFVALHHVSWSQFPTRRGWARFQNGLRAVSVMATPTEVADASALLLALAMNYAAPGSSEMVALATDATE